MNNHNLRPIPKEKMGRGGYRPGSGAKPKAATILKEKLADYAGSAIDAFKFCTKLMHDETAEKNIRLAAAKEVMDRLWGKSSQSIEMAGKDGKPIKISVLNYANPK